MWPLSFVLADDLTMDMFPRGMNAGLWGNTSCCCVEALRD